MASFGYRTVSRVVTDEASTDAEDGEKNSSVLEVDTSNVSHAKKMREDKETAFPDDAAKGKRKKKWALEQLLSLSEEKNGQDLMNTAHMVIEEDWAFESAAAPLPGNIYRLIAFGALGHSGMNAVNSGMNCRDAFLQSASMMTKIAGGLAIWVTQIFGPPFIILSFVFGIGVDDESKLHLDALRTENFGTSVILEWRTFSLTKVIGFLFVFCFILHTLAASLSEANDWIKIHEMFVFFATGTGAYVGWVVLMLDAWCACWVMCWCCVAAPIVVGMASDPREVLYDGLSLLFLFKLDDFGSELDVFKDCEWPLYKFGWIYEKMVKKPMRKSNSVSRTPCLGPCLFDTPTLNAYGQSPDDSEDDIYGPVFKKRIEKHAEDRMLITNYCVLICFRITHCFIALCLLLPLAFLFINFQSMILEKAYVCKDPTEAVCTDFTKYVLTHKGVPI